MEFVLKPNIIIAYFLVILLVGLPKVLGWMGIDTLGFLFQPVITMFAFLLAGVILLFPYLLNPVRGLFLFVLIILMSSIFTMGLHYGTVNPFSMTISSYGFLGVFV